MPESPDAKAFDELLSDLAGQAIVAQQALDQGYRLRLQAFEAFALANNMARLFVPQHLVLMSQSIECQFSTTSESLRQVQLMNQVMSKRYQMQCNAHRVRIEIRRVPLAPGTAIDSTRGEDNG